MIARARLVFALAVVAGVVVLATEFPLGQLLRERASLAEAGSQLSRLQAENRDLAGQLRLLGEEGTVARIAYAEYGLVSRGERPVVVLPSSGGGAGTSPLAFSTVPSSDLVPSDAIVSSTPTGGAPRPGFWARLVQRLEFWKAVP